MEARMRDLLPSIVGQVPGEPPLVPGVRALLGRLAGIRPLRGGGCL